MQSLGVVALVIIDAWQGMSVPAEKNTSCLGNVMGFLLSSNSLFFFVGDE